MGWLSDVFGGDKETKIEYAPPRQLPDYAEAEGARKNWYDTLNTWQNMPGYGAIGPNWDDIWENARGKIQRQYWGGPEGPGAVAKVRADLARRNVSENPAATDVIGRLTMQEGNTLADIALNQAVQEAAFGEQGRTTWLNSTMQLAGLKPQFQQSGYTQTTKGNFLGDLLGGIGEYAMAGDGPGSAIQDFLQTLGLGGSFGGAQEAIMDPSGLGSADRYPMDERWPAEQPMGGGGPDWTQMLMQYLPQLLGAI